jgi:EAL domain-containing protein (putative c-di-GMP-specific phosphodiesterase class I)
MSHHSSTEPTPSIHDIIESRAVLTHFQPILSARQKSIVGLEALTRGLIGVEALSRGYVKTAAGLISPDQLFKMAQAEGRTSELETICRETAIRTFAKLADRPADLILFLNVELSVLHDHHAIVGQLHDLVRLAGLMPGNVAIEILEGRIDDMRRLQSLVAMFRECGFLMVLDDVGAGHSNLDRIPLIQPDILKIDRGLITRIDNDYHKQETLKSLVGLSRKIGALVVAEGIETEDEAIVALELGADLLQGFFLGKPGEAQCGDLQNASSRIDSLARKFKNYMVSKINSRKLQHRRFNVILNQILCNLTSADAARFDEVLNETIIEHPNVECIYVLDEAGVQISDTICNPSVPRREGGVMFRPAPRGADHSLKEYYYILLDVELQKYTTDPYVSLASGNICRTISTCFRDASNNRMYVLCIDVLCE